MQAGSKPHTQTSGFSLCFNSFRPRNKKSGCTLPSQMAPMNRFAFNFPIKFTGTSRMPLFHFLMVCAVEIVSRTFLHALGIPNSLKLLFQARPPIWHLQYALPSPKSWLHLTLASARPRMERNKSDMSPWRATLASFEFLQR